MKRTAVFILAVLAFAAAFAAGWYARSRASAPEQKARRKILYWIDPMHPAYKSDQPGVAPDCGMKLVPVYADGAAGAGSTPAKTKILYYRDPQDPSYRSDKPGLNPETGNELEPVYEGAANTISISAEKQQLIGVTYAVAELSSGAETIPAVGRIAQDETRITRVHPKIEGWIEKVYADFTGQLVNKGDPLLTIYSPEMLASEQELIVALRARDMMRAGPSREAYENSELLIEAARRRLELWDLSAAQIGEIERRRNTIRTITLYSPAAGYITARNAFPSQRVSPDTELYAIADLSRVWILADVFETDLPKIRTGQSAIVSLPNTGRTFLAKVSYIQPQIDPTSRTLKVRLEAPNPDLKLKPDMFVNVEFRIALPRRVTVPADAVLNTGLRKSVFVDRGNGVLERREVQTGDRMGDRIQVTSGLRAGERVVASGAFLVDSEAQLKGAAHDQSHH
ncbi:MAG TPA: efflux RND transporter periplasmic adaptor subunit [Bryobacteraceae bacterium]|jgi:RND family efflux transporter MFP subunit|nr:efflux RND transporter periplasmic adaptor subunit [Bryobacteraceae bacterium]